MPWIVSGYPTILPRRQMRTCTERALFGRVVACSQRLDTRRLWNLPGGVGEHGYQCLKFDTLTLCVQSSFIRRRERLYADFPRTREFAWARGCFACRWESRLECRIHGQCWSGRRGLGTPCEGGGRQFPSLLLRRLIAWDLRFSRLRQEDAADPAS